MSTEQTDLVELTQEEYNKLTLDEEVEYVSRLADKIVPEQDEAIRQFAINTEETTPD